VLALLLMRRRLLRWESPLEFSHGRTEQGRRDADETMTFYCPKRDASYVVAVARPTGERIHEIQEQLSEWLIADAA
jgi:hypothetical protein